MGSIDISILNQKYLLKGDGSEEHLKEVAELVRRKVEALKKKNPSMTLHKAAMLTAFELASQVIQGRKKALDYRSLILSKAGDLLQRVEGEIEKLDSNSLQ